VTARSPLEVGIKAPDFTLTSTSGTPVNLYEQAAKHRATVIAFYVLDFTPG
jgi:peroxiredoxin